MDPGFIAKSDLFRILSLAFSYPDEANLSELRNLISEFLSCAPENSVTECLNRIVRCADGPILRREYSDLFLKGDVPISETSYSRNLDAISDVSAFYKAFGVSAKSGDIPDSLPYQLQFMAVLALKTSLANNEEDKKIVENAYKKFLNQHLQQFSLRFSENLKEKTQNNFYLASISLLQNLIFL